MKKISWQIKLGIALIVLSVAIYYIHFAIFRDAHHIFIYLIGDIAFVFFEVFLVSLIIHQVLSEKEKQERLKKMNMVISAFFSEVGTRLLQLFSEFDPDVKRIADELLIKPDWDEDKFLSVHKNLKNFEYNADGTKGSLIELRNFLVEKRGFLLGLLGNQNLLEHDSFTNLLWAVFHLTEELENRADVKHLPENDLKHICGDMKRAYTILVSEWLDYMMHLKEKYPYLFSLAVRTNPFDVNATVEVK